MQGLTGMPKRRLDTLLAERGLFPSRTRAAASVMAGEVQLGAARRRAFKPGELVEADELVAVLAGPEYVSRGGIKLANALQATSLQVAGRRAIDVGSSTGGFTDCLLQHGAREVIAVDVGYGVLDYRLRQDPRVLVMERTNARELSAGDAPGLALGCLRAARSRDHRRVVHLAGEGPAGGAGLPGGPLRRAGARQAPVRARPRSCPEGRRGARFRPAARGAGVGRNGGPRPRGGGARLPLLGPARAEGQPRDVHLADARRRATPAPTRRRPGRRAPDPAALEDMAREVEP